MIEIESVGWRVRGGVRVAEVRMGAWSWGWGLSLAVMAASESRFAAGRISE